MTSTKEQQQQLFEKLEATKRQWKEEEEDETDKLLNEAIALSLEQGKGWAPGEREAYLERILDDEFIPPIFCSTQDELETTGLSEAFSTLVYDEPPSHYMLECKRKGNEAFMNGKRNEAKNVQYYRDAVNHYYEAFAWAQKIQVKEEKEEDDEAEEGYNEEELNEMMSTLCANAAMAHLQLKNWGHVRDEAQKALNYNSKNIKAWYRLAKAFEALQDWEAAGDAIDGGLAVHSNHADLVALQKRLAQKVRRARLARQQRERKRAERVSRVKAVWKWCRDQNIQLGRFPLVATVTDDEEEAEYDGEGQESCWHFHFPHSGRLPQNNNDGIWTWPCMFVYPSHQQSDFIEHMEQSEMLAMRMVEMFPELEQGQDSTSISWDYNNQFYSSNLAVYFEVHQCANYYKNNKKNSNKHDDVLHPDFVEKLDSQASAMRFYEAARALKGDEGDNMVYLARAVERKHLHKQRKAWKKKHGSLWAKPDPNPLVRVHPAATLRDVLVDDRMVVPNFLVTFIIFPEKHPAHDEYLKEHKCIGLLEPKNGEN